MKQEGQKLKLEVEVEVKASDLPLEKQDSVTRSVLPSWRAVLAPCELSGEQKVLRDFLVGKLLQSKWEVEGEERPTANIEHPTSNVRAES